MVASVDIENVKKFVESDKFTQFLVNNTTQFGTAAFILQTLLDKIEEIKEEYEE